MKLKKQKAWCLVYKTDGHIADTVRSEEKNWSYPVFADRKSAIAEKKTSPNYYKDFRIARVEIREVE